MQHLYRLDLGCFIDDRLVGGIEVFASHEVDTQKWAFLRTFGYDVVEIKVVDDDAMPAFPDLDAACSTFPGGPTTRSILVEPFTRRPYHAQLAGYPLLEDVQAWEKRTAPAILRDYDARLNAALSENLALFRRF